MADTSYIIDLILQAKNQATAELNKVGANIDQLKEKSVKMSESTKTALKAVGATATAIAGSIIAVGKSAIDSANEWNTGVVTMNTMLKNTGKSTDEAIKSLNKYISTQAKTSVLSNDVALAIAKQGAAFELSANNIEKLLPAVENYILGEKGLNATTEDAKGLMNGLAQALNGNYASLTRNGWVLDEETKALLSNGDETERVSALVEILNSQYEGLNETLGETTQGMLIKMRNKWDDIKQTLGEALIPVLNDLLTAIAPVLDKISDFVANNSETVASFMKWGAGIALVVAGLSGLALALPAITSAIGILTGPIGLVIGAVTALALAWKNNWGGIQDKTMEVIEFIKPYIEEAITSIRAFWEQNGEQIKAVLSAFWEWIKIGVEVGLETLKLAFEGFFTVLGVLVDVFQGDWEGAWEKIKKFGESVVKTIDKIMTSAFGDMWQNIKDGFMEGYNRIVDKVNALVDKIKQAVQRLKNAWNSAKEWLGIGGDGSRASGGPVYQGQSYLVGENGPEMFVPSQNGRIVKNEDLGNSGGAGGDIVVNINMGGVAVNNGADEQSLADTIAETITRQLELYKKGIY